MQKLTRFIWVISRELLIRVECSGLELVMGSRNAQNNVNKKKVVSLHLHLRTHCTLLHQSNIHICNYPSWAEQKSKTVTLLVCSLPCDLQVHSLFIINVLSVCVCEAWLFWFTEKLCWMSVSLRWVGRLPDPRLLHFVCALTQSHTHPVWVYSFSPSNRLLNLTHMQTYKQPEPPGVAPILSATDPRNLQILTNS